MSYPQLQILIISWIQQKKNYLEYEIFYKTISRIDYFELSKCLFNEMQNLKWRKDEGMDDGIHYEDWSDIWDEEARYSLDGRDKQGRPCK